MSEEPAPEGDAPPSSEGAEFEDVADAFRTLLVEFLDENRDEIASVVGASEADRSAETDGGDGLAEGTVGNGSAGPNGSGASAVDEATGGERREDEEELIETLVDEFVEEYGERLATVDEAELEDGDVDLPSDLETLVDGLGETETFEDGDQAVAVALRKFFDEHEEVREAAVVHAYAEHDMSIGFAAELAGLSTVETTKLLKEHGVDPELGPADDAETRREEAETARDVFGP